MDETRAYMLKKFGQQLSDDIELPRDMAFSPYAPIVATRGMGVSTGFSHHAPLPPMSSKPLSKMAELVNGLGFNRAGLSRAQTKTWFEFDKVWRRSVLVFFHRMLLVRSTYAQVVLQFAAILANPTSTYNSWRQFVVEYFLADNTVQVIHFAVYTRCFLCLYCVGRWTNTVWVQCSN